MAKSTEIRESRKATLIGKTAGWLMRILCASQRFEPVDRCGIGEKGSFPQPFSKVRVIFDEALAVLAGLSESVFEEWRLRIELVLRAGVENFTEES